MLPTRNGVGPSCVALPPGDWLLIADFLVHRFPKVGKAEWLARLQRGDVLDEAGQVVSSGAAYRPHTRLYYYRRVDDEPHIPFEEAVLYQDELLVVADKPHFLPVTPSGRYVQETLLVRLKRRLGIDTLAPMHRIDRETAGVVLFTVQPGTRRRYQDLFRDRHVVKHYEAVAPCRSTLTGSILTGPLVHRSRVVPAPAFMTMCENPGEPNSETFIQQGERCGEWARYDLRPTTGVKHQLRVHMAALGVPIRHDLMYPVLQPESAADGLAEYPPALQLLARAVSFTDPVTGQVRQFESRRTLALGLEPAQR